MDKRHKNRSMKKWNLVDKSSRSYNNKLESCEMIDQPWLRWSTARMTWSEEIFVIERSDPSGDIMQECPHDECEDLFRLNK